MHNPIPIKENIIQLNYKNLIKDFIQGGVYMKKMFLGAMLFFGGLIGIYMFIAMSIVHPWSYNNIVGLRGFLLGSKNYFFFVICCTSTLLGILICVYEAYGTEIKKIIDNIKSKILYYRDL